MAGERIYTGAGEDVRALFANGALRYGECSITLSGLSIGVAGPYEYGTITEDFYVSIEPWETKIRNSERVLKNYYELQRDGSLTTLKVKNYENGYECDMLSDFINIGWGCKPRFGYSESTLRVVIDSNSGDVKRLKTKLQFHTRGLLSIFDFIKTKSPAVACK